MTPPFSQEQAKSHIRRLIEQYRALPESERRLVTEASYDPHPGAGRPDFCRGQTLWGHPGVGPGPQNYLRDCHAGPIGPARHGHLNRAEFEHILGTFPLVFPPSTEGQARKAEVLGVFERFEEVTQGWSKGS